MVPLILCACTGQWPSLLKCFPNMNMHRSLFCMLGIDKSRKFIFFSIVLTKFWLVLWLVQYRLPQPLLLWSLWTKSTSVEKGLQNNGHRKDVPNRSVLTKISKKGHLEIQTKVSNYKSLLTHKFILSIISDWWLLLGSACRMMNVWLSYISALFSVSYE